MTYKVRVFLDSGAFSAWKLGKPVDLDAYCHYLIDNQDWLECYAALDLIIPDDPEKAAQLSMNNLVYMRSLGLSPIPIWHVRESVDWLKRMLDLGCSYIGLSATSIVSRTATDDWYEMAWSYLVDQQGAPLVKVHAFGESRVEILQRYPWTSADSSTWLEGEKRGTMILPSGHWMGHMKKLDHSSSRPDIDLLEGSDSEEFQAVLRELGIRPEALLDRNSRAARIARSYVTASRFQEIQRQVQARLPIRFIPPAAGLITGPRPPAKRSWEFEGFNLYLAAGTNSLAMPCLHRLEIGNVLVSYFYVTPKLHGLLRGFAEDPEGTMSRPPYLQYYTQLQEIVPREQDSTQAGPAGHDVAGPPAASSPL